jgi:hypothetical protein
MIEYRAKIIKIALSYVVSNNIRLIKQAQGR